MGPEAISRAMARTNTTISICVLPRVYDYYDIRRLESSFCRRQQLPAARRFYVMPLFIAYTYYLPAAYLFTVMIISMIYASPLAMP